MNLAAAQQRLRENERQRLICWRDLQAAIVDYARAVAPLEVSYFGGRNPIVGPKHVPRVKLDLNSCFEKHLPHVMVSLGGRNKQPFIAQSIFDTYQTALMAIGVAIRNSYCPVVSIPAVTEAVALFRLTGATLPVHEHKWRARKVQQFLTRQIAWRNRLYKLERAAEVIARHAPAVIAA